MIQFRVSSQWPKTIWAIGKNFVLRTQCRLKFIRPLASSATYVSSHCTETLNFEFLLFLPHPLFLGSCCFRRGTLLDDGVTL